MIKFFLCSLVILSAVSVSAQTNPKIGSEKGIKEKLIRIKKGLPDIKKNLTTPDENFTDDYNVKFDMGNGIIIFEEDEEEKEQSLLIRYTSSYFSGTVAEYQAFYKNLVTMTREVFTPGYEYKETEEGKTLRTVFLEKGKDETSSNTRISLECSWVLESPGPSIHIYISSKLK